jgi:hypothetical protein
MSAPIFRIRRDQDGNFYLNLHSRVDDSLLLSSRKFPIRAHAEMLAMHLRFLATMEQSFHCYTINGRHKFRILDWKGQSLAWSRNFTSEAEMLTARYAVGRDAPVAILRSDRAA